MYSKTPRLKSSKGCVRIKVSNGWLQLVFSHPITTSSGEIRTKRFYLSTGQKDTPFGCRASQAIAIRRHWRSRILAA